MIFNHTQKHVINTGHATGQVIVITITTTKILVRQIIQINNTIINI